MQRRLLGWSCRDALAEETHWQAVCLFLLQQEDEKLSPRSLWEPGLILGAAGRGLWKDELWVL
jgi:hypothetical protein